MQVFIENTKLLIDEYNDMARIAQMKAYISVGSEIQKEEIKVIKGYRIDLKRLKEKFANKKLENEANLVFCIDNGLKVLQYELEMLINIKEDNMNKAWHRLAQAQIVFGTVIRNYPFDASIFDGYIERLLNYEKLLFPPMHFQSVGGIIKQSKCSICGEDFKKCDHIKGKLYMGELCCRKITEFELEECSIVENPASKLNRVISIKYDDKEIDVLTLREIKKQ